MTFPWPTRTIVELAQSDGIAYGVLKPGEFVHSGPPMIKVTDIRTNAVVDNHLHRISQPLHSEFRRTVLQGGELLVSIQGTVGRVAIVPERHAGSNISRTLAMVRLQYPEFAEWIRWFLLSPGGQRAINASTGGTTRDSLNLRDLRALSVPIAPIAEQLRVVHTIDTHLSRLDATFALLTRAKANVKRARASVLKAAVEGRLVPGEAALAHAEGRDYEPASALLSRMAEERKAAWTASGPQDKYKEPVAPAMDWSTTLPEGWCPTSLDAVTQFVTSGSRGWAEYYSDTGPMFVRSQDINSYSLRLKEVAHVNLPRGVEGSRTRLTRGDVLVIITGANVTVSAWVSQEISEAYINQHVALCRPVSTALSPFLHIWLRADGAGKTQLEVKAYGAGKPGLNLSNLRELFVALPPLAEQHRIVAEVDRRLSVLDALEATIDANLARCDKLRQAILKRAFEGRLVPAESTQPSAPSARPAPTAPAPTTEAQLPLFNQDAPR